MKKVEDFGRCLIVVTRGGTAVVVIAPETAREIMDGEFLDDNGPGVKLEPGVYWVTLEYWWQQGYDDCGRPCAGECDWEMRVSHATAATVS